MSSSGDKTLKAISCLTEWALPEKRETGRDIDTNLDTEPRLNQLQSTPGTADTFARYVSPFNVAFSTQLGLFSWFELPGNESRSRRFGHAMVGTRQYEIKKEVLRGTDALCRARSPTPQPTTDIDCVNRIFVG